MAGGPGEGRALTDPLAVEQAWERLTTHLEWANQFWLLFVFTDDPRVVDLLRSRAQAQLEGMGRSLVEMRPSTPEFEGLGGIDGLVGELVEGRHDAVAWVDLVRHDGEWDKAWERLCMQLNQRRELLRQRWAGGGIVFSTTLDRLDATPTMAPDLWTFRALLLRVATLPAEVVPESVFERFEAEAQPQDARKDRDVELARQAVARARRRSDEIGLLEGLTALAEATRANESLVHAREAQGLAKRLLDGPGEQPRERIAACLVRLGRVFVDAGERGEAGACYRGCLDLLVAIHGTRERPEVAAALMGLADAYVRADRDVSGYSLAVQEPALRATQEAVEILRGLASAQPDSHLPELARALWHLGIRLSSLGRREEALAVTQEAVAIQRKLAEARPDAFLPDLAKVLNSLGVDLSSLGRREEALAVTQEGVEIRRKLAEARPDAFLPDLASALNNLGIYHANLGLHLQARDHLAEGFRIILPFFVELPAAHAETTTKLARALRRQQDAHGAAIPDALAPAVAHVLDRDQTEPPSWSEADLERAWSFVSANSRAEPAPLEPEVAEPRWVFAVRWAVILVVVVVVILAMRML